MENRTLSPPIVAQDCLDAIYTNRSSRLGEIRTTCVFWGHLIYFVDAVSELPTSRDTAEQRVITDAFLSHLAHRIDLVSKQTLLFESDVEREWQKSTLTSFPAFTEQTRSNPSTILEILGSYPALSHLLRSLVESSIDSYITFMKACDSSFTTAASLFATPGKDWKTIKWCRIQDSDPHGRGKSVIFVGESPAQITAVYKPRNLALEKWITAMLKELSQADPRTRNWFLPVYLLDNDHGWMSHVRHRCVHDREGVERYYFRAGFLLGLCQTLGITDCHRDNLVANGDSPCPVDLEAAFHHVAHPDAPSRKGRVLPPEMEWNCMSTGLLPSWAWKGNDFRGIDLSGLGSLNPQCCSIALPQVVQDAKFGERFLRDGVPLWPGRNRVFNNTDLQFPWQYIDCIQKGFEASLIQIRIPRSFSNLKPSAEFPVRFLARPTAAYHYAIYASTHPYYLQSEKKRFAFLQDCFGKLDSKLGPDVVAAEIDACMIADIPRFETVGSGLTVKEVATNRECFLPQTEFLPGHQEAQQRVQKTPSPARIRFEKKLISGSLLALSTHVTVPRKTDPAVVDSPASTPPHEPKLLAARAIHQLQNRIITDYAEDSVGDQWLGYRASPDSSFEFTELGVDLYSGISGILYAFSLDSNCSRQLTTYFQGLVKGCLRRTIDELLAPETKLGGAYFGPISAVLPLLTICRQFGTANLSAELVEVAAKRLGQCALQRDYSAFWGTDLSAGVAGALSVAVSLVRSGFDYGLLRSIELLVELLISKGRWASATEFVWPQPGLSTEATSGLCGVAHGNSGSLVSLAEARTLGLPERVTQTIDKHLSGAIEWELARFSQSLSRWPDFRRTLSQQKVIPTEFAWCHGGPGILFALSRVESLTQYHPLRTFLDGFAFVDYCDQMLNSPKPLDDSLCHGGLGNYALTRLVTPRFHIHKICGELQIWCRIQDWVSADIEATSPAIIRAPGLMIGRSGSLAFWNSLTVDDYSRLPFLPFVFEKAIAA